MGSKKIIAGLAAGVAFALLPFATATSGPNAGHVPLLDRLHAGPRPVDLRLYWAAKARAEAALHRAFRPHAPAPTAATTASPKVGVGWSGVSESDVSPPDSNGAIGPNSYAEIINNQIGLYDRTGKTISTGGLENVTGTGHLDLSDPQMLWDTQTNRFYFTVADVTDNTIRFGFSKSANPASVSFADWCGYRADFGYGSSLPDFPKLGQSSAFLMISGNVFNAAGNYVGSDLDTISKPQATGTLTTCPTGPSFIADRHVGVVDCGGGFAWSLEPAQQAGSSDTGWVTAVPQRVNLGGSASTLDLYRVTKGTNGHSQLSPGTCVNAGMSYSMPADAPQLLSLFPLDTIDGSLLHAVVAPDPSLPGTGTQWGLWTSHAIAGGAGSMVRWYEIHVYPDSTPPSLAQAGNISDPSLYVFDPAISPDRLATGATSGSFGSNAVIGVTTSSFLSEPAIQMAAKRQGQAQSGLVMVHQSSSPDNGFDCLATLTNPDDPQDPNHCRWGDYSGATPDPGASTTDTVGRVWLTSMYGANGLPLISLPTAANWGTYNWEARP